MPAPRQAARAVPAAELRAQVESFLAGCRHPILLEPGEPPFSLADSSQYQLTGRPDCLLLEVWDESRTLARRVVAVQDVKAARMTLTVARFGGKPGAITLADRERAQAAPALLRGTREVLRELLRRWLARQFPGWAVEGISTGADLEHTLSPAYPRALLRRGQTRRAVLAAPRGGADAALAFGLIWLHYLQRRDRQPVEGLVLFLPESEWMNTAIRLPHLHLAAWLFGYGETGLEEPLDPRDCGNLSTRLEPWREPPSEPSCFAGEWLRQLCLLPGVERVIPAPGEASLRINGLEFARYSAGQLRYGIDRKQPARGLSAVESLAAELARIRHPDAPEPLHPWLLRNPEAWLESRLRAHPEILDASLLRECLHGQVPAFSGQDRGVLDLLAARRDGRLCVVEVKATEDPQLPLQALDYWIRVAHHAARGDFAGQGYFRGLQVRPDPPKLLLVAPALAFHPTTEILLGFFSPRIEVERIGLGVEWQRTPRVVLRVAGAQRPEWIRQDDSACPWDS